MIRFEPGLDKVCDFCGNVGSRDDYYFILHKFDHRLMCDICQNSALNNWEYEHIFHKNPYAADYNYMMMEWVKSRGVHN